MYCADTLMEDAQPRGLCMASAGNGGGSGSLQYAPGDVPVAVKDNSQCGDRSRSRHRDAFPEEKPPWLESLLTQVKTENTSLLKDVRRDNENTVTRIETTFNERMDKTDKRVDHMEAEMKQMKDAMAGLKAAINQRPQAAPSSKGGGRGQHFIQSKIEIRGICEHNEKTTKGISREECDVLYKGLLSVLPESLRSKVGNFQLRGIRSFGVSIPVPPELLQEILDHWRQGLENGTIPGMSSRPYKGLFVRPDINPELLPRYRKCGEMVNVIKQRCRNGTVKEKYAPDFAAYIMDDSGGTHFVGQVKKDLDVNWGDTQTLLAVTKEELEQELAVALAH